MVQALVEDAADEDVSGVGFTGLSVDHALTAGVIEAVADEGVAQAALLLTAEGGAVDAAAFHGADLATDHLEDVGDGHARRNRVRVDDEVRHHAVFGERHVLRLKEATNHALLTVAGRELVADFGHLVAAHDDAHQAAAVQGFGHVDVVHVAHFSMTNEHRGLTAFLGLQEGPTARLFEEAGRAGLADEHVATGQVGFRDGQTVAFEVLVGRFGLEALDLLERGARLLDFFDLTAGEALSLRVVGAVEGRATEGTLNRPTVHDDGVLHVVAVQRHDGHDEVLTTGALVEARGAHRIGLGDRAVRVVQDVGAGVGSQSVVGAGQSEGLLHHRRTAGHARCGVVLRVRDERRADTEHQLWVNLTVGVLVAVLKFNLKRGGPPLTVGQADLGLEHGAAGVDLTHVGPGDVLAGHGAAGMVASFGDLLRQEEGARGDEEVFLFFSVHPFDDALGEQVSERGLAGAQLFKVTGRQAWRAVVQDEQGAQNTTLVGVDEDVTVFSVVADGDLRRNQAASAGVLELVDEVRAVVVDAVDVTVHVNTVTVGPVVGLVDVHVIELSANHGVVHLF